MASIDHLLSDAPAEEVLCAVLRILEAHYQQKAEQCAGIRGGSPESRWIKQWELLKQTESSPEEALAAYVRFMQVELDGDSVSVSALSDHNTLYMNTVGQ